MARTVGVFETFVDRVDALLESTPDIYEFSSKHSSFERAAAIRALPPHAADAVLDILTNIIFEMHELDAAQKNLEYLMGARDWDCDDLGTDVRGYSDDWRLRVYENNGDVLYDFNGWPDDVESGAGVFYPAEDPDNPVDVFTNGDENLVSAADEFEAVVADYETRRRDVLIDVLGANMHDPL
jgi:hypothetical protein